MSDSSPPRTPRELIERTERSWQSWLETIDGIPEDRLAEPMVGHWSGKDLLGHVAFWEDWVVGECQRILAGQSETSDDLDPLNQQQVADSQSATVSSQKRYRDEAHARLIAFLATIPDDSPHFAALVKALEWETYAHYDEHAAQVRAWREAEGL